MRKIYVLLLGLVLACTLFTAAPANAYYVASNAEHCWSGPDKPEAHPTVCMAIYYREDTDGHGIKLDQIGITLSGRGWANPGVNGNYIECRQADGVLLWSRQQNATDVTYKAPDYANKNLFPNVVNLGTTAITCTYSGIADVTLIPNEDFTFSTTAT